MRRKAHLRDDRIVPVGSFAGRSLDEIEAHMNVRKYGDFTLPDAVRPSYDLQVVPKQGYRYDAYVNPEDKAQFPVIMAAVTAEKLFAVFMEMLGNFDSTVDIVLETSHQSDNEKHRDLHRDAIDLPVLQSILEDYEDLLVHDGCTGIAVLDADVPQELQLEEHKLLIVYGEPFAAYEAILHRQGVRRKDGLQFLTEADHVHCSSDTNYEQFQKLANALGVA